MGNGTKGPLKPEIPEVHEFLARRNALIVHFSGTPRGGGMNHETSHLFPTDLQHVLEQKAMGGLSCSVVRPGDVFAGTCRNATGSIGVVLGLQFKHSLVAVAPDDCGSIVDACGNRIVAEEKNIRRDDLERTLDDRTTYNEWVVRDYKVLGVFAAPPFQVSIMKVPEFPDDTPQELRNDTPVPDFRCVTLDELATQFRDVPIFTFAQSGISRKTTDGLVPAQHSEIYVTS